MRSTSGHSSVKQEKKSYVVVRDSRMPTLSLTAQPQSWRASLEMMSRLTSPGINWTVVKNSDAIVLLLGRPRPSPVEQSRLLTACRLWLYDLTSCNVVQHALDDGENFAGWHISVNYKRPDREGVVQWLNSAS